MNLAEPSTQLRPAPAPKLFLWVASLLYVGVLVTGVYYSVVASVASWRIIAFIGLMLALLALEQWEQQLDNQFFANDQHAAQDCRPGA